MLLRRCIILCLNKTNIFAQFKFFQVKKIEESVYLESGRRPISSETSRLLDNVTKRFRKNKQRQEQLASIELDARYSETLIHIS